MALPMKKKAEPDLASEIHRVRLQIDQYIDQKVAELKLSRDGASQPVEMLKHMLVRGDTCMCRAALRLLDE